MYFQVCWPPSDRPDAENDGTWEGSGVTSSTISRFGTYGTPWRSLIERPASGATQANSPPHRAWYSALPRAPESACHPATPRTEMRCKFWQSTETTAVATMARDPPHHP